MMQGVSETMALLRIFVCLALLISGVQSHADIGVQISASAATGPAAGSIVIAQAAPGSLSRPLPACKLDPPRGYPEIESIAYECNDIEQMINAQAVIDARVTQIFEQRRRAKSVEVKQQRAQRNREQAAQQRAQAEAARKAEQALRQEQEALAASEAVRVELSSAITRKMVTLCQKTWAEGEHRCYCEKYLAFAPEHIPSNPDCN